MTSIVTLSIRSLAGLALVAVFSAQPVRAQDAASGSTPDAVVPTAAENDSAAALATAARNIIELLEEHRFRIKRIDAALGNFRGQGDENRVRQYSLMREREQASYQQTLETYRRLLGEEDFSRVTGLLRNYFERLQGATGTQVASNNPVTTPVRIDPSATERAERARAAIAAEAAERRNREEQLAAYQRSQAIARVRSSERQQLAERLEQSRQTQIAQREAQVRRYQPPTPAGAASRGSGISGSPPRGSTTRGTPTTRSNGAASTRGTTSSRGRP